MQPLDERQTPCAAAPAAQIAARALEIEPFEVMQILARAQRLEAQGRHIVHMEIGEPDFTAPPRVVDEGVRALREGRTAYTGALGLPELRAAICAHYAERFSADVPASRIAVTAGASGGLLLAMALYVQPGDEVLVPDPGYPGYRHFVRTFEGRARALEVTEHTAFQPSLDAVARAWGPRTRALVVGSPGNPSGTLLPRGELTRIAAFIAERRGVLFVDEIYQGLVYDCDPETLAGSAGDVVVINSFSKYFCMTGWRLGWVVLPEQHVRRFEPLAQHLYICPPSAAQWAALAAFDRETIAELESRRREFQRRRDCLIPALEHAGLKVPVTPNGAFYVYADCSAYGLDSRKLCLDLLEQAGIACTPGADFGTARAGRFVRFAYTRALADIEEAGRRLATFARRHGVKPCAGA